MAASLGRPANSFESTPSRRSTRPKSLTNTPKSSSSIAVTQTDKYPWRSPDELQYIEEEDIPRDVDLSQPILIEYLCSKAFSIPPREASSNVQLFQVTTRGGSTVSLPRGYRVPLMFVAKFQWDSLKLVLTSSDPQKEWDEYKLDIVHLSRLFHHLFAQAEEVKKTALAKGAKGIDRLWRSTTFDRVLTRFYHRWFISRDRFIRLFWEEFGEDEYEDDILKHDWVRWSVKGHKGFTLTKDEIQHGITTQQFMLGLERNAQGGWNWNVDQATGLRSTRPSTIESTSSTNTVPHVREQTCSAEITISKFDELFGVRTISRTPSHNTLEVKKEHLELRERMSAERTANDSPFPEGISDAPKEIAQNSTTQATPDPATPVDVFHQATPLVLPSDLPPQKNHMFSKNVEKSSDTTQPPASTVVKHKRIRFIQARKSMPAAWWRRQDMQIQRRDSPSSLEEESSTDEDDAKDGDYKGPRKKRVKTSHSHESSSRTKINLPTSTTLDKSESPRKKRVKTSHSNESSSRTKIDLPTSTTLDKSGDYEGPRKKRVKTSHSHESSSRTKIDLPTSTTLDKSGKLLPVPTLKTPRHKQPQRKASKPASNSNGKKQGRSQTTSKADLKRGGSQTTSMSDTIPRVIASENFQAGTPNSLSATEGLVGLNPSDSANSGLRSLFGNASTAIESVPHKPNAHTQNTVGSLIEPSSLVTTNLEPDTAINHTPTHIQLEVSSTISDEKPSESTSTSEERIKDGAERGEARTNPTSHNDFTQTATSTPFCFGRSVFPPNPSFVDNDEKLPNSPLLNDDGRIACSPPVRFGCSTSPPNASHLKSAGGLRDTSLSTLDGKRDNDLTQIFPLIPLHLDRSVSPASRSIAERQECLTGTLLASCAEQGEDTTLAITRPPLLSGRSISPPAISPVVLPSPMSAVPSARPGPPLDLPVSSPTLLPQAPRASISPSSSQVSLGQPTQEINATCPLSSSSCEAELHTPSIAIPIHSKPSPHPSLVSAITNTPKTAGHDDRMNVDESMTGRVPGEEIRRYLTSLLSISNHNKLQRAILVLRGLLGQHKGLVIPGDRHRHIAAEEQERLSATEHLDILAKCSGLLSAYGTIYSGQELEAKLSELDDRLYEELLSLGPLETETTDVAIQIVPQPCMLIDKGVDTVSLNMSGFPPINDREATELHQSPGREQEALRQSPPVMPVAREPLTPDATMVDVSSLQQPSVVSSHSDIMKTEASLSDPEITPTVTRIMTSIMRNMADLLDCSSGGQDVKGKGRMVDDVGATRLTDGLPIVSALLQEFKMMKQDMRKSLESNKAEMDSMVRLHRMEVNTLKDELRTSEDIYRRETEVLRQRHRQEIGSLMDNLTDAQRDREKDSAEVESCSSMSELFDLRRRILALEGHTRSFPLSPAQPAPSTHPLFEDESDVTITRRMVTHPLGHLFEADDGFVPPTPVLHRSFDGIASVSKPGTPIQFDREGSNAIVINDSIPLPIKSQRKFVNRFWVT